MYSFIKSILFKKAPEEAHHFTMNLLIKASKIGFLRNIIAEFCKPKANHLSQKLWGITFENPVGLAAGFDKDAKYIDELSLLGFGFIEIGTLTPKAQDGNPQPRLFRLPADNALINRMGFNNGGVDAAVLRLKQRKSKVIIGGNIGKNKITDNELADKDYEYCFRALYEVVDYFTVNVSSPNTPNLRALQDKEPLEKLLNRLKLVNIELGKPKPILLKIAPDLTWTQLDDIIAIVQNTKIDGIVATNTTIDRSGLQTPLESIEKIGAGGLSGSPLKDKSTAVIKYITEQSKGQIPIMAVGGIETAADAQEKLDAGAKLIQIYTGFIYEGPAIVKNICNGIKLQKS